MKIRAPRLTKALILRTLKQHDDALKQYSVKRIGLLAAIGIEKGKPFAPDARMKKILTEAAAVGKATEPSSTGRTASDAIFRDVRQPGHLSQRLDCGHQARRSVGGDRTDAGIQG